MPERFLPAPNGPETPHLNPSLEAAQPTPTQEQPTGKVVVVEAVPGTYEAYNEKTGELVDINSGEE